MCNHGAADCLGPSCLPCLQRCGRPALPGLPGIPAAAQGSAQRRDGGRQEAEGAAGGHQLGWVGVRGLNIAAQQLQLPGWLGNRGRRQQWPCCRPFSSQLSILSLQSADSIRLRAFAAAAVGPLRTAILKFYAQVGGADAVHAAPAVMQKGHAHVLLRQAPLKPALFYCFDSHCPCRPPATPTACCPSWPTESSSRLTAATTHRST